MKKSNKKKETKTKQNIPALSVEVLKESLSNIKDKPSSITSILPNLLQMYLKYLEEAYSECDKLSIKELESLLEIKNELYEIFFFYFDHEEREDIIKPQVIEYLLSKLEIINNSYIDLLDFSNNEDWNILLIEFLSSHCDIFTKENKEKTSASIINKLINTTILNNDSIVSVGVLSMIYNTFSNNDLFYTELKEILKSYTSIKFTNYQTNNLLNFLLNLPSLKDVSEEIIPLAKEVFQLAIITFLDMFELNDSKTTALFLKRLNSNLFSLCKDPLILPEYILKIYKSERRDNNIKILSLSCLFILITRYNFIFENYYETLYDSLHIEGILSSSNSKRLFTIMYQSLKQPSVARSIVCSFIKKMARVALISSSETCMRIVVFIEHIFHYHHKSLSLLYRKRKVKSTGTDSEIKMNSFPLSNKLLSHKRRKETEVEKDQADNENERSHIEEESFDDEITHQAKYDLFNANEKNPNYTNATKSCLWELYTLNKHFNYKVRERVNKLSKKFIKKDLFIDQILNISREDALFDLNEKNNFYITASSEDELKEKMLKLIS